MFDKVLLHDISLLKIEKGDYISFDLSCGTLFKVLDTTRKYVLIEGVDFCGEYWERKEYICHVFKVRPLTSGVRYFLEKEKLL